VVVVVECRLRWGSAEEEIRCEAGGTKDGTAARAIVGRSGEDKGHAKWDERESYAAIAFL